MYLQMKKPCQKNEKKGTKNEYTQARLLNPFIKKKNQLQFQAKVDNECEACV